MLAVEVFPLKLRSLKRFSLSGLSFLWSVFASVGIVNAQSTSPVVQEVDPVLIGEAVEAVPREAITFSECNYSAGQKPIARNT